MRKRLPDGSEFSYQYDRVGNRTSQFVDGPFGSLRPRTVANYSYDALNRLVSVGDGTLQASYHYDGLNRLTEVRHEKEELIKLCIIFTTFLN